MASNKATGLGSFLIKAAIVIGGIIVVLNYLDSLVEMRMAEVKDSFSNIGGRAFWGKVERELDRLADPGSDLSPEKKQRILTEIRTISDRWRPFINEAQQAFVPPTKTQ